MKHCNACNTTKPSGDFHKRAASKDGLSAKCKQCQSEYDRKRAHLPKRVKARKDYEERMKGNPEFNQKTAEAKRRWAEKNPEKRQAQVAVGNALRDGILKKEPCAICSDDEVHGHHVDYSKPLDVIWLCNTCHNSIHIYENMKSQIMNKEYAIS